MTDLVAKWEKIQTIQDFAFILSLDSVTMEVKGKMRDIMKAEAQKPKVFRIAAFLRAIFFRTKRAKTLLATCQKSA